MIRLSQLFFTTLREDPAEAEVASHRLLLRAGYIRRAGAGLYSWLPLGLRVRRNIERVIREHFERHPDERIGEIRGRGAMMALEFVDPATGEPDAALTGAVAAAARRAGVVLLTCGTYGNVVRFLPPLVISEELLREGLGVVSEALAAA